MSNMKSDGVKRYLRAAGGHKGKDTAIRSESISEIRTVQSRFDTMLQRISLGARLKGLEIWNIEYARSYSNRCR
jgi:hypothetical protein